MAVRGKKKPAKASRKSGGSKRPSKARKAAAAKKKKPKPAKKPKAAKKSSAKKPKKVAPKGKVSPAAKKAAAKKLLQAKKALAAKKAREQDQKRRDKERADKQRAREQEQKKREKERLKKQQDAERAKKAKERLAAQEATKKQRTLERQRLKAEREAERRRLKAEQEAEKQRLIQERDRQREELRRQKEEERAKKEAEREAYRKAKEAERERLRAEKEAARRALEGKVARASKRALRAALGRGATTRVYRPDAIPNQSGTTRQVSDAARLRFQASEAAAALRPPERLISHVAPAPPVPEPPPMPRERPRTESIEERYRSITGRLKNVADEFQREYRESFDMSWIYHDSALEGVVYTFQELRTAIDPNITVVPDSSLQPVCEEIRRHRAAIELVRELAERRRIPISVDIVKRIYLTLHPEEGDLKSVKYRKDIPQHRLYFHEYAAPDKIAYKVRQVIDWLNGPEPKKIKNAVRVAARVHYDLLRVFPFPNDSGKVARLLMNLLLLRAEHPPSIIHSTERQRYYEALRGTLPVINQMVTESIDNSLQSIEKLLDEEELRHPRPPSAEAEPGAKSPSSKPPSPFSSSSSPPDFDSDSDPPEEEPPEEDPPESEPPESDADD